MDPVAAYWLTKFAVKAQPCLFSYDFHCAVTFVLCISLTASRAWGAHIRPSCGLLRLLCYCSAFGPGGHRRLLRAPHLRTLLAYLR
jgi:hypothetical protein